jgi:hypothetical protein
VKHSRDENVETIKHSRFIILFSFFFFFFNSFFPFFMKLFIILCLNFIFVYATQVPLNFDLVINNLGASHGGDFDGLGNRFVCDELASSEYRIGSLFFKTTRKQFDNAMCRGQVLTLPNQSLGGMYMLGSVNHGPVTTKMVVAYKDGTQTTTTLNIPDWQVRHTEQIERLDLAPCRLNTGAEGQLFLIPLLVDPTKNVSHLTFPYTDTLGWFRPALHVFGITALPANDGVTVVAAKGTRRTYISRSGREYQIVMVRVHNTSPAWIDEGYVSIMGTLLKTHKRGRVKKLAPGHIVSVEVTIRTLRTTMEKTSILVDVTDNDGHPIALSTVLDDVELGIEDYKGTEE